MIDINNNKMPVVWTISSSDSSSGTGIQADLLTFHDYGVHGCSVVTAINAQTSFATGSSVACERKSVVAQINALDSDFPPTVIKLATLPNHEIAETVVKYFNDFKGFVVYDLSLASSGDDLLGASENLLKTELLPRVDLLVVNIAEAAVLTGLSIDKPEDMASVAQALLDMGARSVLITGAHFSNTKGQRYDFWAESRQSSWVTIQAEASVNNRGGGNTLTAAITAAIAKGLTMNEAIQLGKAYVTRGIRGSVQLGSGPGSVAHLGFPDNDDDRPVLSENFPG